VATHHTTPTITATWTGIIGELTLAVFKGAIGYFSDSKALLADAMYSASEFSTLLAAKISWKKTSDSTKGKVGNIQPVIAILFSILVLMGGVQIAESAIQNLSKRNLDAPGQFSLIAMCISFAVRETIFQFQYRLFKKRNNEDRQMDYVSNHRLGIYSSVIVFLGVFLSIVGEWYAWPGLIYMDSIAGIIVSVLVLRKGYLLIVDSIYGGLNDQELVEENIANFIDTIQRVHGIISVDDLKTYEVGHYIVIHVKVSVNPRVTVFEAHDISERAKKLLMNRFLHVSDVFIYVAPYDAGFPYKSNHELVDQNRPTILQ
jgi:cation diffusion facilitator family transporter